MSASYVRTKFREWSEETAISTGIPFYDTVNKEQNPSDDVWFTSEFYSFDFQGTFCEKGYLENGEIEVVVFARPGIGDTQAMNALEQIIPALMYKIDPTGRLILQSYLPVQEDGNGSAKMWYSVSVGIVYKHSL